VSRKGKIAFGEYLRYLGRVMPLKITASSNTAILLFPTSVHNQPPAEKLASGRLMRE
jgi:hypothetical protein